MIKPEISNFLQTAIQSMSADNFDTLVKIFETDYLRNEVVNVNGANDGGNDIRIFQNRREVKKCVQLTTNKLFEKKLKDDLVKVDRLVSQHSYSDCFDFFCSARVSEGKMDELKKFALDTYAINLTIYDSNRLSQLECKPMQEFIYSLYSDIETRIKPAPMNKTNKLLYDILAGGKTTNEIKNSILQSVIISIIYEHTEIKVDVLKKDVEKRMGLSVPDIEHSIQLLKTNQRVVRGASMESVRLSPIETDYMRAITADSNRIETDFLNTLDEICDRYGIVDKTAMLNQLLKMYKSIYQHDIDEYDSPKKHIDNESNEFMTYITSALLDKNNVVSLVEEVRHLCENNSYLNRITASTSFLNLYKSNELDYYISHKSKIVFLDTPAFIYYICASYMEDIKWDNPYFKSIQSLMQIQHDCSDSINFYIMEDYLLEVAGELIKGLQCCWIEQTNIGQYLGETNNTFFNFYQYLKSSELFEVSDDINSFEDFVEDLGFETSEVDIHMFSHQFCEMAENLDIMVVKRQYYSEFQEARNIYEKSLGLSGKYKSPSAIAHDVSQILYLLDVDNSDFGDMGYTHDIYSNLGFFICNLKEETY